MTEKEIDLNEYISDEKLKELGYTKETFKGSDLELLLQCIILSTEDAIQDETQRLMKKKSLSYGEARAIATKIVIQSFKNGIKRKK